MTPDEVSRLRPAKKVGDAGEEKIVAPGQMLIFVSGRRPILGTQMLYFLDPHLSARASIPPPADFDVIEQNTQEDLDDLVAELEPNIGTTEMQKNRIDLAGYAAGRADRIRYLPSGTKVANIRLGESYRYQGKDNQQVTHTNWHALTFYDDLADL
ncbi:MAG: type secretion system protein VirD4, partial [Hyphomicrobiales bacterium]|nr:type secretion system protein VirD4 [Hyphomicrobiales bacterium]